MNEIARVKPLDDEIPTAVLHYDTEQNDCDLTHKLG